MKRHIKKYFITGLLVIIPIWGTYLVLSTLLKFLEGFLGSFLQNFGYYIPGMGILSLLLLILIIGTFATNFIGKKVVAAWERILSRLPLVSNIYSVFKHIVDTVSIQGKENFSRVVLVEFPQDGVYSIGFVTGVTTGEVQEITEERVINVFMPHSPLPTTGFFIFVPEKSVIPISMSVEDGMKMIVSGGLYTPPYFGSRKQSLIKFSKDKDKDAEDVKTGLEE